MSQSSMRLPLGGRLTYVKEKTRLIAIYSRFRPDPVTREEKVAFGGTPEFVQCFEYGAAIFHDPFWDGETGAKQIKQQLRKTAGDRFVRRPVTVFGLFDDVPELVMSSDDEPEAEPVRGPHAIPKLTCDNIRRFLRQSLHDYGVAGPKLWPGSSNNIFE